MSGISSTIFVFLCDSVNLNDSHVSAVPTKVFHKWKGRKI